MLERAEELTREYHLLPPGSRVLCAVSGGADSVALLRWLADRGDLELHAGHFDHRLRGEASAADAAFVRELCEDWSIPFHLGWADVAREADERGAGVEETGRALRYAFLEETAKTLGEGTILATAHTAGDNAETMLFNLTRGAGLRGLRGILPDRALPGGTRVVRPLLTTEREELLAFLEKRGIPHREDASNADETYTRNRLRRQVMPVLTGVNPRAVERMGETARQLRELDAWLEEETARRLADARWEGNRATLPMDALTEAPEPVRPRMLQALLERLGVPRKDFGAVHLRAILALGPGGHLDLPREVTAQRKRGMLTLEIGNNHSQERKRRK